jgi:hypothetical protein
VGGCCRVQGANDGHSLDPYEVMFVKFKQDPVLARDPAAALAAKYQYWQEQQLEQDDWDKQSIAGRLRRAAAPPPAQGSRRWCILCPVLAGAGTHDSWEGGRAPNQPAQPAQSAWALSNAAANEYPQLAPRIKLPKVLLALRRGSRCFDLGFYTDSNPDVAAMTKGDETAAWKHFVFHGQFHDRPYRYTCDDLDYSAIASPPA